MLLVKFNRFVIKKEERPQEIFDGMMNIVGKIWGVDDEFYNKKVVKRLFNFFSS